MSETVVFISEQRVRMRAGTAVKRSNRNSRRNREKPQRPLQFENQTVIIGLYMEENVTVNRNKKLDITPEKAGKLLYKWDILL